jgi:hypothetical protein
MKEEKQLKVINGYVIGDRSGPAQPLSVGVGESTQQLIERNPFLATLGINSGRPLNLPLLTKLDVSYDDGIVKLKVGCAHSGGLDGDEKFPGVGHAGFTMCEPNINDWTAATRQATTLIQTFRQANPSAEDIQRWAAAVSRQEWKAFAGDIDVPREVLSESQANARFADLAARGHPMEFQQDYSVEMGIFRSGRTMFSIGITKDRAFNGDVTEEQKKAMTYRVGVSFLLLAEVKAK